jgi:DNA polymerase-1
LDERQGTHSLERLSVKWYRAPAYKSMFRAKMGLRGFKADNIFAGLIEKVSKKDLFNYNGADTDYTYRLARDLTKEVVEEGQLPVLRDIEMPAMRMFTEFYMTGILVDREYLETMGRAWKKRIKELNSKIIEQTGNPEFNSNSPKQLAHFMYDELGLLPFGGKESVGLARIPEEVISAAIRTVKDPEAREYWTSKRTATSQSAEGTLKGISSRSTAAYVLYWLKQQHEFPGMILEMRHLKKRMSMYYTALKKHMYKDGRVRPQYDTTATRTGRKSSRNPAMHNLPRGDEIYNLFIPDPGWCMIHADYAQAELRYMAFYSGDKALLHILNTSDIHTEMVKEIYKLTDADIKKMDKTELSDKRIAAKMLTFGIPYGRSAAGLAPQLGVSVKEAEGYIKSYFNKVPGLHQWLLNQRKKGIEEQILTSVFGRKRRFPLITGHMHRKEIERQSGNFPIQSGLNDLTMIAYFNSIGAIRDEGMPCKPGMQVHDSIGLFVPIPFWVRAVEIVAKTMAILPFETDVPFPAEVEVGPRWGELYTVINKKGEWEQVDEKAPEYIRRNIPRSNE